MNRFYVFAELSGNSLYSWIGKSCRFGGWRIKNRMMMYVNIKLSPSSTQHDTQPTNQQPLESVKYFRTSTTILNLGAVAFLCTYSADNEIIVFMEWGFQIKEQEQWMKEERHKRPHPPAITRCLSFWHVCVYCYHRGRVPTTFLNSIISTTTILCNASASDMDTGMIGQDKSGDSWWNINFYCPFVVDGFL